MTQIHVPKGITKNELYTYITNLRQSSVTKIQAKYRAQLEPLTVKIYQKVSPILVKTDKLKAELEAINLDAAYQMTGQYAVDRLRQARGNFASSPSISVQNNLNTKALQVTSITWDSTWMEDIHGLVDLVKEWNIIVARCQTEINQANTLQKELNILVKTEKKAAKGYIALASVGLDMSSFEKKTSAVPAILQPSVDIGMFNNAAVKEE